MSCCPSRSTALATLTVELHLPDEDDLRYTRTYHHLERLQGSNEAADKNTVRVKVKATTREPGRYGGRVHRLRKSLTQSEAIPIKQVIGNQGCGLDMIAGGQSKCDVVVFPPSRSTLQVQQNC